TADLLDLLLRDRPLLARLQDPRPQLRAIERHPAPVLLDDAELDLLDRLVRREPAPALEALPPTADDRRVPGGPRIDHLGVVGLAVRARHRACARSPPASSSAPLRPVGSRSARCRPAPLLRTMGRDSLAQPLVCQRRSDATAWGYVT